MRKLFVKETACEKAKKRFDGALDGELSPKQERELSAHLSTCEYCRKELKMRQQIQNAMRMEQRTAPYALHNAVMRRVSEEKQSFSLPHLPRPVATLAGALCALVIVVGLMSSPLFDFGFGNGIKCEDALASAPEANKPNSSYDEDLDNQFTGMDSVVDNCEQETSPTTTAVYTLNNSSITVALADNNIAYVTDELGKIKEGTYKLNDNTLTVRLDNNKAVFTVADDTLILKEGSLFD